MQINPNSHLPNRFIMKKQIGLFKGLLILVASLSFGTLFGQNHALLLNGSGSYVDGGDFLTPSYTKEVWVKLDVDNIKPNNNIISGQSGHAFRLINGMADAGHNRQWTEVQDPQRIEAGWQHYAVTYDESTQTLTLYRNGEEVSQKVGVSPNTDASVQIGSFSTCCYFRGMMDEVRIWDYARDGADIAADYNRALTGTESGLLAYYSFNQGIADGDNTGITTVNDLSGKNDGVLRSFALTANATSNFVASDLSIGPPEVTTTFGNALQFNGTGSFAACGDFLTPSYTKEVWIKLDVDNLKANNNIISGQSGHAFRIVYGKADAGQAGNWTQVQDPNSIEAGWQHYAVTYDDSTQLMTLYRNGEQVAQKVGVGPNMDASLQLGSFSRCCYFRGIMDEVRIWDYARSGADIASDYQEALTGTEPGLLAYYNFDQGIANGDNTGITTITDLTGNNNGTLQGFTLTPNSTSNFVQSDLGSVQQEVALTPGNALHFDGQNDFVECGNLLSKSYTKEAWINVPINSGRHNNLISGDNGSEHAFWVPMHHGYKVAAGHNGKWYEVEDPNPVASGWNHYAVTYDEASKTMILYKNGEQVSINSNVSAFSGTGATLLGSFRRGYTYEGTLDEVRVWNYARSQGDIAANYRKGLQGSEEGLVVYYNFNQGVVDGENTGISKVNDLTARHDGTLNNFARTPGSTSNFVASGVTPQE